MSQSSAELSKKLPKKSNCPSVCGTSKGTHMDVRARSRLAHALTMKAASSEYCFCDMSQSSSWYMYTWSMTCHMRSAREPVWRRW
ncbi:hypothetical protein HYQ46_007723 [Verticillium longisporum]|nr:hypothetical protein HYQ46_007723 [Verticillium longisporum]